MADLITLNKKNASTDSDTSTEPPLVRLSTLAAQKVDEIRTEEGDEIEESMSLRLRVVGGGSSGFSYDLYFDNESSLDRIFHHHGIQMLIDEMSLMYLYGTEVDYVEGLAGAGFKFNNPNVRTTCGCGSSFAV